MVVKEDEAAADALARSTGTGWRWGTDGEGVRVEF
jgi:hypothetical protein